MKDGKEKKAEKRKEKYAHTNYSNNFNANIFNLLFIELLLFPPLLSDPEILHNCTNKIANSEFHINQISSGEKKIIVLINGS